jgi:hypothetical protein
VFYTIYKIVHTGSGKEYIGKHQTKDLDDGYMGSGKVLRRAVEKHGAGKFRKEILHVFQTEQEMNDKEAELVTEEYCDRNDTYNLCPGGHGGFGYINKNRLQCLHDRKKSNEIRRKNEKWLKKTIETGTQNLDSKKALESLKKKYPKGAFYGKKHTEEWKKSHSLLMKERQKGKKNSQYGTMWITNGAENRKIKKDLPLPEGWRKGRSLNDRE